MKIGTPTFRGMAPRISPRLLPDVAAQQATNARLLTGDLEAWKRPAEVEQLANPDVVRSIFKFDDIILSYAEEVEFARGAVLDDDADPRVYITGLDAPRFTTYSLATGSAAPPYPADTRLLGVPAPDTAPAVTVNVAAPAESNITLTNPGAEAGNTSGWTITAGALVAYENGDIPGQNAQAGTWFFGSSAVAATAAYQSVALETLGVVTGQGLRLAWYQARGANSSTAGMEIEFYNQGGALLSSVAADQVAPAALNTWEQRTLETQVPDGAVTARLVQRFTRVGAGDLDAYIDSVTLSAIDYTNSFDGSSFGGWTVSANRGTNDSDQHRIVQIDSTVGWPAPSFYMRCDELVPYFYRDFSTDRSPSITVQFDFQEDRTRTNGGLHVLLYGSRSGAGQSIFFSTWGGLRLYGHPDWNHIGATVQQLATPGFVTDRRYTVTLSSQLVSSTQATVTISVLDTVTGSLVVDQVTATVSVDGEYLGFKGGPGDLHNVWNIDNLAVTIAAPDPADDAEPVYTSYVYTFINEFGEESAPSDPSDTVQRNDNATTIITTPTTVPTGTSADYGIVSKRIYRSVTGALGSIFRFVAEIPLEQDDYTDQVVDAQLGEELESTDWDVPPTDLRYILALPNGIMVGASGNRLCFSVQNRPHAWPVGYRLAVDSPITGLGNADTTVVVGTQTFVYTASGNSPDSYSMSKPVAPHACKSARGVAFVTGLGVVFPGPDGLMAVTGPTEVRNVTEGIYTREQWQALQPDTILGVSHDDVYFFFVGQPPQPNTIFEDTFDGVEDTQIQSHTPNIAPTGFAWTQDNAPSSYVILDGAGAAMSNVAILDASADSDGSSPALSIPIEFPFEIELHADREVETVGVFERAEFSLRGPGDDQFISVSIFSNEVYAYAARVEVENVLSETAGLTGDQVHTVRAVISATSVAFYADGVLIGTYPHTLAMTTGTRIFLYVAAESTMRYRARYAAIRNGVSPAQDVAGYLLDLRQTGGGLVQLGMHASAVCNDLVDDSLLMVLDQYEEPETDLLPPQSGVISPDARTVYEWAAAQQAMRALWKGKLWQFAPKAWRWMRVLADSFDELQANVYADGVLLYQRLITSNAAFRLPLRQDYRRLEVELVGTDTVQSVEVADSVEEFT